MRARGAWQLGIPSVLSDWLRVGARRQDVDPLGAGAGAGRAPANRGASGAVGSPAARGARAASARGYDGGGDQHSLSHRQQFVGRWGAGDHAHGAETRPGGGQEAAVARPHPQCGAPSVRDRAEEPAGRRSSASGRETFVSSTDGDHAGGGTRSTSGGATGREAESEPQARGSRARAWAARTSAAHDRIDQAGARTNQGTCAAGQHALSSQTPQRVRDPRSEEHTSELQSLAYLVCRLLLEKKKKRLNAR